MKTTHSTRRSGFTLIELLIVISIIAILAAVSIPTTAMVMNKVKKTQAGAQVANLVNAIKLYEAKYGTLPIGNSGGGEERIATDEDFMDIITGVDRDQQPTGDRILRRQECQASQRQQTSHQRHGRPGRRFVLARRFLGQ